MEAVSKKVILLGHFGVGKTSMIKRFVYHKFSKEYMTTIGVKIDKKVIKIGDTELSMIIWDIAGESTHTRIPQSYKLGSHGAIYVVDVMRPSTYENIDSEIKSLKKIMPALPIVKVANKTDLLVENEASELYKDLPLDQYIHCSAKTGEHVEKIFGLLAKQMLE